MFLENKTGKIQGCAKHTPSSTGTHRPACPALMKEENTMSIMGVVYYDKYTDQHRIPGWARAERYEYCEDFLTETGSQKKGNLLQRITAVLLSIF
jgi:hypothetical protein